MTREHMCLEATFEMLLLDCTELPLTSWLAFRKIQRWKNNWFHFGHHSAFMRNWDVGKLRSPSGRIHLNVCQTRNISQGYFLELREVDLTSLYMETFVLKDEIMYLLCAHISNFIVYLWVLICAGDCDVKRYLAVYVCVTKVMLTFWLAS